MSYATISHVEARNTARPAFTATSRPNISQVAQYIQETAAEVDAALTDGGYSAPVDMALVPSTVQMRLQYINSVGAAYHAEASAQTSVKREEFQQMWQSALKMLRSGELPGMPKDSAQSLPRTNPVATPFFQRDMEL